MKILIVHNRYQQYGGEDSAVVNESSLLAEHGAEVLRYERRNDDIRERGIWGVLGAGVGTVWSERSYREITEILDREHPDIVHVHNTLPLLSPSIYYACRKRGTPVVQTIHNYRLMCPAGTFFRNGSVCEECRTSSLMASVIHSCYRNSAVASATVAAMLAIHWRCGTYTKVISRYIALTNFAKRKLMDAGISGKKIDVKPNFIPNLHKPGADPRQYFVFVGRLSEEKGVRLLVKAWSKLDGIVLRVYGDGPLHDELRREAESRDLLVEFLGASSKDAVTDGMRGAKAMVAPSLWYEGLPMVVVEAFAAGTPVIASDIGGLAEIVVHERTGLKFRAGDANDLAQQVRRMSQEKDLANRMGIVARAEYESKYSPEKNYEQLMTIYRRTIDEARQREA